MKWKILSKNLHLTSVEPKKILVSITGIKLSAFLHTLSQYVVMIIFFTLCNIPKLLSCYFVQRQ
jgi:hypothetical protein